MNSGANEAWFPVNFYLMIDRLEMQVSALRVLGFGAFTMSLAYTQAV